MISFDANLVRDARSQLDNTRVILLTKLGQVIGHALRSGIGETTKCEIDVLLHGYVEFRANRFIRKLDQMEEAGMLLELVCLHKVFPEFGEDSEFVTQMVHAHQLLVNKVLADDEARYTRYMGDLMVRDIIARLAGYRQAFDELVNPIAPGMSWESWRYDDGVSDQTVDLDLDKADLIREMCR